MNEWMMHLYSALCIFVHPTRFKIMLGGGSPQPPPVCSIHMDALDVYIYTYIHTVPSISIVNVKTQLLCWLWSQSIYKYD